jgi:thiol-disulfide isomerase/thioredoxin
MRRGRVRLHCAEEAQEDEIHTRGQREVDQPRNYPSPHPESWAEQLRIAARRGGALLGERLETNRDVPLVLYFKSPGCVICRSEQEPQLERLDALGDVAFELQTVDVAQDPETAKRYRVLSAPTTFVLDRSGIVKAVNLGPATAEALKGQLRTAS